MIDDLRSQFKAVEAWGDLVRIRKEVNPRFELPGICKKLEADKAVLFEKVQGHSMPVVVGMENNRSRIARVLGTDDFQFMPRYLEAIRSPPPSLRERMAKCGKIRSCGSRRSRIGKTRSIKIC